MTGPQPGIVDRASRDRLTLALRRLASGRCSSDDFFNADMDLLESPDEAIVRIVTAVYWGYLLQSFQIPWEASAESRVETSPCARDPVSSVGPAVRMAAEAAMELHPRPPVAHNSWCRGSRLETPCCVAKARVR